MARTASKRWPLYLILAYIVLWVLTAVHGPAKLQAQEFSRTVALSERIKKGMEEDRSDPMAQELAIEIASGPHTSVDLLSCPLPLYFKAETKSAVGNRYQMSSTSWYIYTPWQLYAQSNLRK